MNTTLNATLNELAADMRVDRDYCTIFNSAKSAEFPVGDLPADVLEAIMADSPLCETVRLTVFTRKGERFYMAAAQKGSRDGFPVITRKFEQPERF